ncbi:MAG TPA: ParM/StbA family protein [Ktedonosporobacter sp.]|nr:ParM/StbA family protein [Ktedonosporobacter sp.]
MFLPNYTTYAYGHDYGNSKTCGVTWINTQQYALTMPSALAQGSYELLQTKVSSTSSANLAGILNQRAHIIEVVGKLSYSVGNLAIDQNPTADIASLTSRGDVSRYWSDRNLAMLLTTSATIIRDPEYGLAVVANLPIATHNEINVRSVKAALDGDHVFLLDGAKRTAHIRVMKTVMEGAGATIAFGPGGTSKVGVVDIGGRSTDAYLVVGQIPVEGLCKSLDVGVETAFDQLVAAFETAFRYPLSAADARAIQECYVHGQSYDVVPTIANAEVDPQRVDDLIDEILRTTGKQMAGFLKRVWRSSMATDVVLSDTPTILLIGGGAYYFEEDIRPLFRKRLSVPAHPEFANATGFAKLALHYLQREQMRAQHTS